MSEGVGAYMVFSWSFNLTNDKTTVSVWGLWVSRVRVFDFELLLNKAHELKCRVYRPYITHAYANLGSQWRERFLTNLSAGFVDDNLLGESSIRDSGQISKPGIDYTLRHWKHRGRHCLTLQAYKR